MFGTSNRNQYNSGGVFNKPATTTQPVNADPQINTLTGFANSFKTITSNICDQFEGMEFQLLMDKAVKAEFESDKAMLELHGSKLIQTVESKFQGLLQLYEEASDPEYFNEAFLSKLSSSTLL